MIYLSQYGVKYKIILTLYWLGGLTLCIARAEGVPQFPAPVEKCLIEYVFGLEGMFIAKFFKASLLKKKIRPITLIVLALGKVEKRQQQKKGNKMYFLFCFLKQISWHVSTFIFQGLFKNIIFRSVALVTKNLWAILVFFYTDRTFFRPVPSRMH